jgi:hypothetical protein
MEHLLDLADIVGESGRALDGMVARPWQVDLDDPVALSCGFSGAEVFSRTFRSHFGQSPREFRSNFSTDRLHRFHPEFVQRLG